MAETPKLHNHIPEFEGSDEPRKLPRLPKAPEDRFQCAWYGDDVRGSECVRRQCEAREKSDTPRCVSGKCQQGRDVAARLGQEAPDRTPAPPARRYGLVERGEPLQLGTLLRPDGERRPPEAPSAVMAELKGADPTRSRAAEARLREAQGGPVLASANDTPHARPRPNAAPSVEAGPPPERAMPETTQAERRVCLRCKKNRIKSNNTTGVCTDCRLSMGNPSPELLKSKLRAEGIDPETGEKVDPVQPAAAKAVPPTRKPRKGGSKRKAKAPFRAAVAAMFKNPERVTVGGLPLVRGAGVGPSGRVVLSEVPYEDLLVELSTRLARGDASEQALKQVGQALAGAGVSRG